MDQLNSVITKELAVERVSGKIQKIIFDIIFQHVQDMVFVMKVEEGPCFRYLFVNESGMRKAKLSPDAIGRTLGDVLPFEAAQFLQQKYEELLNNKNIVFFDDWFYFDNEEKIYGETILTPIYNKKNVIRYIVGVTRDITEWSIEKNKIIESEQRYRSIVDNNLDAIFTLSPEGTILETNPAASLLTGYSDKQMKNCSIYDFIDDRELENLMSLLEQSFSGSALDSLECKFIHLNGLLFYVHLRTVPIVIHGEIKGIYVICKDLSEQTKYMERIKFLAFHDQLTGLLNRRALLEHINELINTSAKNEFALISIDLDRFKYLNDSLGHLAGDEILKRVADRLSQFQNEKCFVYRQGGDEFNILLHDRNRIETSLFVQKVFSAFVHSFYFNSHECYISPSIGISMYPSDGRDAEMLIKNADVALFRVKEKGKAHYQFYRTGMSSCYHNVLTLETHLRKAAERGELHLFYQPQIDVETGKARSFEALLRWDNSDFGLIPPNDFIPLAEDTGLIISIGHWVIEKACEQIMKWNELGFQDIRIAINISPKQFQQHSLVDFVRLMIEKYKISGSSLEIEITEGVMNDTNETIPILKKLKELGLTISVDDFGTGYSSLNYLKQFPIDVLKIDQSFISDILIDKKNAAITSTIIHLGKSLGLEVIAEGVETREQVEFLVKAQCQKIQGYYYSKPVSPEEIEKKFLFQTLSSV